jgi:methionine sulfoxide reductase heme-binding subunit
MTVATSVAPHLFWITSRAAGIVSLVLASLAVSLGLVMSLRMMRARRPDLLALHEVLSLGTLVALAVHGLSLLGDSFLHPSIADIAIPFVFGYKTAWTSIGIIGGWALVFLGLSYYARHMIGANRWRRLHRLTALAWIAGIVHTLGEGTDAGQVWFLAMLAVVAVPALLLLAVRYLTDEAPRATPGAEDLQARRMDDHEARELPAAPRPPGPALG